LLRTEPIDENQDERQLRTLSKDMADVLEDKPGSPIRVGSNYEAPEIVELNNKK